MPSIERRINLYLNHKLFGEPPLQCSPVWSDESQIVTDEVVALINPMISPNRRDNFSFKIFSTEECGFSFERMSRLRLMNEKKD